MNKAHLIITSNDGEAVLKGECSLCRDVNFAVDNNSRSPLRLIHEMFDSHFRLVHTVETAGAGRWAGTD
jgi:hypothetical protein